MKHILLGGSCALVLCSTLVFAQDAPASLLPPGFEEPVPTPRPTQRPTPAPTPTATSAPRAPSSGSTPVVQPLPGSSSSSSSSTRSTPAKSSSRGNSNPNLPSLRELEAMSVDELDQLLGLRPKFDIPPASRRTLTRVGLLGPGEGGLPPESLSSQSGNIVSAALAGTRGPLVSRWGHIMLRRALASRLAAPDGLNPVDFAALRAQVLNALGEHGVARAVAQDIDTADWNGNLTDAGLDSYLGTADITGACPAVRLQGRGRNDAEWVMWQAICNAFDGETGRARANLQRALRNGIAPPIDLLLAQRYAGAAGEARSAVNIEWDDVEELTPWRFALSVALGEEVPEALRDDASPYYQRVSAIAPALPLTQRVAGTVRAAREGILSSAAMIDFYSELRSVGGGDQTVSGTTAALRQAYISAQPAQRMAAIREIWGGTGQPDYDRQVLTAYAAARIPATEELAAEAAPLIASMLTAGLDRDAMRWASVVPQGSEAWALLALAQPNRANAISSGQLDDFVDDDQSSAQRKSAFLLAGLAGLGRVESGTANDFARRLSIDLARETRWSKLIKSAGRTRNQALVAFLAGVGMQGSSWDKMTARHLYNIVSALNQAGMGAEARMIAAEAVARA